MREPIAIIKKQFTIVDIMKIYISTDYEFKETNAVHSVMAQYRCPFVRDRTKMSQSAYLRWSEKHLDGEQSIVAFLKLYSDNSNMTMKVSGLTLYLLLIKVMDVSEHIKHLMTIHGNTLLYILPMQLLYVLDDMYGEEIV